MGENVRVQEIGQVIRAEGECPTLGETCKGPEGDLNGVRPRAEGLKQEEWSYDHKVDSSLGEAYRKGVLPLNRLDSYDVGLGVHLKRVYDEDTGA